MPFRAVAGHRRLVGLLARSVQRGTLPPSLIFAGPVGAGKRLAATATAQALNCLAPVAFDQEPGVKDACGTCGPCTRIARGVHPDVLVVQPDDNGSIKIDQVRDVIERSAYRPFEGRRRVVVVDDADAMQGPAQNALLKTLEEPPPASVFILITARPDMLLPTVQSRCPRLRFPSVERAPLDREAVEVAERVLAQAAESDDPRARIESAKDLLTGTGAGGAGDRAQVAAHLRAMASLIRDAELLATRASGSRRLPDTAVRGLANPDMRPVLDRLATAYQGERGIRAFTAVDRALVALDRNAGVKIVADWLALNL